jgi:hypothetical protein
MPFTLEQIENTSNAAMELHFQKGKIVSQTIQDKPLLDAMMSKEKSFPGGKDTITGTVKGVYTTGIEGFSNDDQVSYGNPANIKKYTFPWKLVHAGIKFTMHELLQNGIRVVDTTDGSSVSPASDSEKVQLANIYQDKLEDMQEGVDRGMNLMFWRDGTQDSELVPGVTSFVVDDPTASAVVGGIDQAANTWWRNRASLGLSTADASAQVVVTKLQREYRQLRRYGGNPNLWLAGSDFIEWMEKELRSKGNYTLEGWTSKGKTDAGMADISFKGNQIQYDPTLDDLSKAKYLYALDTRFIFPMAIEGESMKKHNPARPEDRYAFYKAVTWVGGLVCNRRNVHGVYSIA